MFRDAEEELKRLEAELLAEEALEAEEAESEIELEDWEAELMDLLDSRDDDLDDLEELKSLLGKSENYESPSIYHNYSNNYGRGPQRYSDEQELEEQYDRLLQEPKENNTPLIITAATLLAGICAVLLWWFVRYFR